MTPGLQFLSAMLEMTIFDDLCKKSNTSAIDGLICVRFHANIANIRLFMMQRKIMKLS